MTLLTATTTASKTDTAKTAVKRVYRHSTISGIFYSYHDGTTASKAEWDAQCARAELDAQERERKEEERKSEQVYSDNPLRYRDNSQGGYSVDRYGRSCNGLIF